MKKKLLFSLSLLAIYFLVSSKVKTNKNICNNIYTDTNLVTRVSVKFNDIVVHRADCGIMVIKVDYKFKLSDASRYKVKSKDGVIKIQFTCPNETGKNFFVDDKLYYFKIVPLNSIKFPSSVIKEPGSDDDIPLYTFVDY